MPEGFVPFPPEFAQRYRDKGYWQDRTLAQEFEGVFQRFADRVALVDGDREFTYAELDQVTNNLALNLLELGLQPLDRVVPTLPNVHEFVILYFALQKIGAIPIAALVTHRFAEINQFVQLSGGTTGIPKLIPRTHNDYAYNSKVASEVTELTQDSTLLLVLPIAHNLPLACPGIQGFMFKGGKVVVHANTRPTEMFALIQKHKITHLKVVPALLIRLINDPSVEDYDLSSLKLIQSGGQRMQPEVRSKTRALIPGVFVQENFGMSEGTLMFVRASDPEEVKLETCGRPVSADDEVLLLDDEGREVPEGEVGEFTVRGPYTLRGYYGVPEYNARQFTPDGFYRSGDLMRKHPSGNYIVEGRKKDLINRGGEKISAEEVENLILMHPAVQNVACVPMPDAAMGEKMCAYVILRPGADLNLGALVAFLLTKEIAKFKLPERLETLAEFPVSTFGKVSKKALGEQITAKLAAERAGLPT